MATEVIHLVPGDYRVTVTCYVLIDESEQALRSAPQVVAVRR